MKTITLPKEAVYNGSLILVNNQNPYREGPYDISLVPLDDKNPTTLLERQSARLLDKLIDELGAREQIVPVSGWRSKTEQTKIYEDCLTVNGKEFTKKYVAVPGYSEHQTGLAIDLAENKPNIDFIRPDFSYEGICRKFREKAPVFGFVERYPKDREEITGIGWEPWHFRYVGFPHAAIMQQREMTLEEYHAFIKKHVFGINPFCYRADGRKIEISYLKADKKGLTSIEIEDGVFCTVSGNNMDGFVVTIWG